MRKNAAIQIGVGICGAAIVTGIMCLIDAYADPYWGLYLLFYPVPAMALLTVLHIVAGTIRLIDPTKLTCFSFEDIGPWPDFEDDVVGRTGIAPKPQLAPAPAPAPAPVVRQAKSRYLEL